jgi:hypothetical protein
MGKYDQFAEVIGAYRRHGWELRRAIVTTASRVEIDDRCATLFGDAMVNEGTCDALWFSRPSVKDREAWELRLVAETPYALFEAFEADETDEQREEVRQEMEARLREYTAKNS